VADNLAGSPSPSPSPTKAGPGEPLDISDVEVGTTAEQGPYKHIMMTFLYKEPVQLIRNTLANLALMNGSENFILLLGIEEKTPDREATIATIDNEFGKIFQELIITVHPFAVIGEIPGKCSNANYA
jgi:hypothetical protein